MDQKGLLKLLPSGQSRTETKKHSNSLRKPGRRKTGRKLLCSQCPAEKKKHFSDRKSLEAHISKIHKRAKLSCDVCGAKLKSNKYLARHILTRHPESPRSFICDFDGKTFAKKDFLRIHMDRHRKYQVLTCEVCMKSYTSKHTFRRHLRSHIERYQCTFCGTFFNQKGLLENHIAAKHTNKTPYACEFCTRTFPSKTARNNHKYIAHKDTKSDLRFQCQICKVGFEMKEELRIHSFIHFTGDIKMCLEDGCDQIFKTNRLLHIHMQKHGEKKSFQCSGCGEFFTFNTGLAKHLRLNRCKGPNSTVKCEEDQNKEIASKQLKEISNPSKNEKSNHIDVFSDFKIDSEPESDDQFSDITAPVKDFTEPEVQNEPREETKENRKIRKRKKLACEVVSRGLITQRTGRAHMIYTCDRCGDRIKFKNKMELHVKSHLPTRKYECEECKTLFKSKKALVDHSLDKHKVKIQVVTGAFKCKTCDRHFDNKSGYEAHKLSHDDSARNHICSICSAAFKSVGNLRRHEAIHAESREHHCKNCEKSFKTALALKIHSDTVHVAFKVFVTCSICKAIVQEKHLKAHLKNQHTAEGLEKPFQCSICLKTFRSEILGQRHYERVHEPKNTGTVYECSECPGLQFNRQRDLKEHSFVHYTGTIYQCTCLKMFKSKRLLTIHQSVHADNPVNFPCKNCHAAFKTRGGLSKHRKKLHSGQDAKIETTSFS